MDVSLIEAQVLGIEKEINQLKASVTPCILLLNEILELRTKRNLSESSNHSVISTLTLQIKSEILREIESGFASAHAVEYYKENTESAIKTLEEETLWARNTLSSTETQLKDNEAQISQCLKHAKENRQKLDDIMYQLEDKVTSSNLNEIRMLIKNCATVSSVDILKNRISDCAAKYQLEEIQKNQILFNKKLQKFTKNKVLIGKLDGFNTEIKDLLEKNYLSKETFYKEKDGILKKSLNDEEKIKEVNNRLDRSESVFEMKHQNLKKKLDSAPWSKSIEEIYKVLESKTDYKNLNTVKNELVSMISQSNTKIAALESSINSFEVILARFDEILLIKAEKEDIKRIENCIQGFVLKSAYDEKIFYIDQIIEKLQDGLKKLIKSSDIMDKHLESVAYKCNTLVKENIDVSLVSKSLQDLRETVDRKANKEDIYEIYDIMGKKIDIINVSESNILCKKQLEMCAVMVLSLCRTLVNTGEATSVVYKKREDLLSSINSLINWISGDMSLKSPKQIFNDSQKPGKAISERPRSIGPSGHRRNSAGKQDQKLMVDFPKIKLI
jgi:hypothetical protein